MARQQFYPSHARLSERRPRTYVPLPASHIICSRVLGRVRCFQYVSVDLISNEKCINCSQGLWASLVGLLLFARIKS